MDPNLISLEEATPAFNLRVAVCIALLCESISSGCPIRRSVLMVGGAQTGQRKDSSPSPCWRKWTHPEIAHHHRHRWMCSNKKKIPRWYRWQNCPRGMMWRIQCGPAAVLNCPTSACVLIQFPVQRAPTFVASTHILPTGANQDFSWTCVCSGRIPPSHWKYKNTA